MGKLLVFKLRNPKPGEIMHLRNVVSDLMPRIKTDGIAALIWTDNLTFEERVTVDEYTIEEESDNG